MKEVLRIVERDMVGTARSRYDLLGSCKWSKSAPTSALERDSLPRAGAAKLAIFARGFSAALARRAEEEDVALVGIDQLFA